MGLLKKITSRILTGKAADSEAANKQELLRKCYFEVMEQRRVLSADPVIAAVTYLEGDTGQDTTPDHFEVSFEGGAETTQLTQFTINGDQDLSGNVSTGDMIFDIDGQLPGTGGNFDFQFDAANSSGVQASDVESVSVSSDGLSLVVGVSNFEAGDVFAFTIDVDEVEGRRNDTIASGIEHEGTFFEAQFVDDNYTFNESDLSLETTLNEGFVQTQVEGVFYDEYDNLFAEGEALTGGDYDLRSDNLNGEENRSTGAVDAYDLEAKPITIEGTVYHDEDIDCVHDENEDGIGGVEINLQRLNELTGEYETVATTTTDNAGHYEFGEDLDIKPGTFRLVEIQPDGYLNVGESAGSSGGVATENVISEIEIPLGGTAATDYDFKEVRPASIQGNVWHDENNDGVFDPNEQGIANVLIQVTRVGAKDGVATDVFADAEPMFVRTDANGHYSVDQLPPGIYQVVEINNYPADEVDPLAAYIDGKDSVGNVGGTTIGSQANDRFTQIELCADDDGVEYNFGEILPASIGGNVSVVTPGSDPNNPNDPLRDPIEGTTIELYDADGNLIATTLTDANGDYEFNGLVPGSYSVVEVQPDGYLDASDHLGNVDGESRGDDSQNDRFTNITLSSGDAGTDYDFCEFLPASISGRVHVDADGDCVYEAGTDEVLAGVTMELLDSDGNVIATTVTDSSGNYSFEGLEPGEYAVRQIQPDGLFSGGQFAGSNGGDAAENLLTAILVSSGEQATSYDFCEVEPASISGRVHVDADGDCVYEAGTDEVLAGVTIELLDSDGNVIASTVTDSSGNYSFEGLEAGEYAVRQIQPDGLFSGGQFAGSNGGDAAENILTAISVNAGDQATNYDFCEVEPASISGRVHVDADGDCVYDAGTDEVLAGVTMELLDSDGVVIATTVTDSSGNYSFEGLEPGEYAVRQIQPDGLFSGGEFAGSNGGDAIENLLTTILVGSGDQATNYDFCEHLPAEIHGRVFEDGPSIETDDGLEVEGYRNLRDGIYNASTDTPIEGVVLELYYYITDDSVTPVPVTLGDVQAEYYSHLGTTDLDTPIWVETMDDGQYWFQGLQAGSYIVLEQQPDGFTDSNDTVGDTTGFTFNDNSEVANAPNNLSTFSTTQLLDAISSIQVDAGGISQFNNFSEVTFVAAPEPPVSQPPPPIPQPPQPPGNPNTPGTGITGFPGLFGSQGIPQTVLDGNTRGLFEGDGQAGGDFDSYSWHLSVVNGGQPRAMGEADSVWSQVGHLENSDWQRFDMNDAVWSFTTTNENSGIVSETGDQSRFGVIGGTPLAGDFNGDGVDEIAMFKDGYWMIDINHNGQWDDGDLMARLGDAMDRPVVGDWDGDGKDDIGIYGPIWERDMEAIDREPGLPNPDNDQYTKPKNVPPVDADATEGARVMRLTSGGGERADVIDHVFGTGTEDQVPVAGDWNGNGVRSIGTFENGRWNLDVNGDGRFTSEDIEAEFGAAGDIPIVGDFDGNGVEEIAIYRAGTWMIDSNGNNELDATDRTFQMGTAADTPVVGDWDGDGVDEPALYRESQLDDVL